ncbi:DUF2254 domain-containing protein [Nocardiopsis sp. NPDC049922]|uniref:DUF2254 domain-containing protein n=1 Tax=Nocardiopsis sp. NPDC049922 TaxID=3155157 RepID=UPI0034006703
MTVRQRVSEYVKESFFLFPSLGAVVFVLLALAVSRFDTPFSLVDPDDQSMVRFAERGRVLLKSAGPTILTVMGLIFSIKLLALQKAGQLTPRVVGLFTRCWVTKATLTIFVGTFIFTFFVPFFGETPRGEGGNLVLLLSGVIAAVLVFSCLIAFLLFAHRSLGMMRLTSVLDRVVSDSLDQLSAFDRVASTVYMSEPGYTHSTVLRLGRGPGILVGANVRALVRYARRHDVLVTLLPKIGDFVAAGSPVVRIDSHGPITPPDVDGMLWTANNRSSYRDPAFGLRQLVDIATRALSPGINDPTTAVQAVDRIQILVTAFGVRELRPIVFTDRHGSARVIQPRPTWPDVMDLAFSEIALYGAESPQVTRRLVAALSDIGQTVGPERRGQTDRYLEHVRALVNDRVPEALRSMSLRPDRQGIGSTCSTHPVAGSGPRTESGERVSGGPGARPAGSPRGGERSWTQVDRSSWTGR